MTSGSKLRTPLVEIAVLSTLLGVANLIFWPHDPGFQHVSPHPSLFLTLLVLARYGLVAGAVAAAVLAAEYVALVMTFGQGATLYYTLSMPLATPLVVLVPTAVFFGMLVQRHLDRQRKAEAEARRATLELERAAAELDQLRDVNVKLGEKVVNAELTTVTLLEQLKRLSTLDCDQLHRAVLNLMVETMRVEAASIWEPAGHGLRLRCYVGAKPPAPLRLDAELIERLAAEELLATHELAGREPLPFLVGSIRAGAAGPVVGYVAVDRLPLRACAEVTRLFAPLCEWLALATGNALAFERMMADRGRLKVVQ